MVIGVFSLKDRAVLRNVAVIIWGIAVLLTALIGCAVVLAMLAAEPNWSEITLALATVVLALATVGLTVAAFFALGSVGELRAARNAVAAMELSRQWDSDESLTSRLRVTELAKKEPGKYGTEYATPGPEGFRSSFEKLAAYNDPEYGKLLRQTNFLDDIALLIKYRGIDFDVVYDSLGFNIAYFWTLWKPTIDWLRHDQPLMYEEFEKLAKRIAAIHPHLKLDQSGEVAWPDFSK
jgi:hypothetical protein